MIRPLYTNELYVSGQPVGATQVSSGYYPLLVQHAKLPASNSARIDAGENIWRLLYASGTTQKADWQFITPQDYSSSLQLRLHFAMRTGQGSTNTVAWYIDSYSSQPNSDSQDFNIKTSRVNSGIHTLAANQSAGLVREQIISLTGYTGSAGHLSRVSISRTGAADTSFSDVELLGLLLEYRKL